MRLFDERLRDDDEIRRAREDTFAFLDRVDDVYFGRVRDLVEEWFGHVPAADQSDLRGRLRANLESNSAGAFWELYLRELLRRSGFALTHEPVRAHRRRPDFLVIGRGTRFYLEAKYVGAAADRQAQQTWVTQITDELKLVDTPDYRLQFGIRRWGRELPPLSRVRTAVERWLAELDYHDVLRAAVAKKPLPERSFDSREWTFWSAPCRGQRRYAGGSRAPARLPLAP